MPDADIHDEERIELNLESYPSFHCLKKHHQDKVITDLDSLIKKGRAEKWMIDFEELDISHKINNGSQADILEATWRNSVIAIKKPRKYKVQLLINNITEINILSSLRHPNLVQFMGLSFNLQFLPHIIMEKINGNTLQIMLSDKNNSLNSRRKQNIMSELVNVIQFLHSCNPPIIYRDLKPDNIMIEKQSGKVKLTDFGLSRFMPDNNNYHMTGETGTVRYMAPEVYNNELYSLNIDIYSLGLIIYYLNTNIKPFTNYSTETIKTYFENPDLVFSTIAIKSKELRTIVNNCIHKDPQKRWNIDTLSTFIENTKTVYTNHKGCALC